MNDKFSFVRSASFGFILLTVVVFIGNGKTCTGADPSVPTCSSDYLKFIQDLQDRSHVDLSKMTKVEPPMLALHAEWILARSAAKDKNDALYRALLTKFGSMLKNQVPTAPDWFVETLTRSCKFNKRVYFDMPTQPPIMKDAVLSFDTTAYDKTLDSLFVIAKSAKLQLGRDFAGEDEVYALCGFKGDSGSSVFLHKYGHANCGKHIIAFDGDGVRWVQRTFHSSISQNSEPDNASRAELVVQGKNLWLFAISYSELMVEGYEIDTGQPTFRLNSLLIDTAFSKK